MRSLRWGALAGTAYVVAILVGNGMDVSGESGGTDATSILADLQRSQSVVNHAGLILEVIGFVLFFFFLGAFHRVLRLAEGEQGWLATSALAAGVASLAVKLGSHSFVIAADYRRDDLTPALARTLVDLGGAAWVVSGLLVAVFTLAAALSALGSGALPRWLGWFGAVVGAVGLVTPVAGYLSPDDYVPLPYLFCLVWVAICGVVLARRPSPIGVAESPGSTAVSVSVASP